MWPRNDGRSTSPIALGRARAGLGELAGDAPDLHDRHAQRVRQHDRHLQDDAQLLPDVVGRELLEALGAVAGLEQERVAGGDLGERRLQRAGLAGEHQRGIRRRSSSAPGRGSSLSGHSGCCSAGRCCHDEGVHASVMAREPTGGLRANWAGFVPAREPGGIRLDSRRQIPPRCRAVGEAQTARMRSASSRRPTTARLTSRRAASAVTPRLSPTSRKLLRSPSSSPKRASTA